jgi:hypothetical protein
MTMTIGPSLAHPAARCLRHLASAAALAMALEVAPPPVAADALTPPHVPLDIQVPAGNRAFLRGHAVGTQDYICLPSGWTLFGPQATLLDDDDRQVMTHFLSPNPDKGDAPAATWQHSRDTSRAWAMKIAESSDAAFVEPGAIPWFLLQVIGAEEGPTGGDKLAATTFIHRVNTTGGVKPSADCTEIGRKELVPYTADYYFYRATNRR